MGECVACDRRGAKFMAAQGQKPSTPQRKLATPPSIADMLNDSADGRRDGRK